MLENGFLGYDASFMLDVVVCALVLVVPVLLFSIYSVKFGKRFALHKTLQLTLAAVLLLAVAAFEVDLRLHGGWENVVNKDSANPRLAGEALSAVRNVLYIHLVFAISTPFLWGVTIVYALRRFPSPPAPGEHSSLHRVLAWASTVDITLTSVTGLWFYYVAFVATS